MSIYLSEGAPNRVIPREEIRAHMVTFVDALGGAPKKVLLLPPDITRFYSEAGFITAVLYELLTARGVAVDVMPAIGTHSPMTEAQALHMFGPSVPFGALKIHDWRGGIVRLGQVPGATLKALSGGKVDYDVAVEIDRALIEGGYDEIISVGQIVPHEVVGMANYTKNICVGVGGVDLINKSHFLGAVCDMEKIMGRADTPVRRLFDQAFDSFVAHLPIRFVMTVIGKQDEKLVVRGLYASDEAEGFLRAAALSQKVNLDLLDKPLKKVVVYLEPDEFKSTWIGNKAVYRTRMVIADDGELVILAPAVREFGEDKAIDALIRKYGYFGTPATLKAVDDNADLRGNLSAAAHLIHGSSEGRFRITYCTRPENLSKAAIEGVGFQWAPYDEMAARYDPRALRNGRNTVDGEEIFFISNPALGLWALRSAFEGK